MNTENTEATATRLARKLSQITSSGKIKWLDAGQLGPWGEGPGQAFKAEVEDGSFAQIAEVPAIILACWRASEKSSRFLLRVCQRNLQQSSENFGAP